MHCPTYQTDLRIPCAREKGRRELNEQHPEQEYLHNRRSSDGWIHHEVLFYSDDGNGKEKKICSFLQAMHLADGLTRLID
jgi:hypothetical protein